MIVIGHRGSAGNEPENTLRSFVRAVLDGADMVELDVHRTRDSRLAVIHDPKVDRTTNGKGKVLEKTMEELWELDAGGGEKIPSLEEAIEAIDQKVPINIEMKSLGAAELVRDTIEFYVTEGWNRRDFMVSSFEHNELNRFKEMCPEVKIGVLTGEVPLGYAEYAEKLGAYSVNITLEAASPAFISDAHNRGIKVFVWTVNKPEDILALEKLGADGVITDFPGKAKDILTES